MSKKLLTIVGPNGVGKSTASKALLQICPHSAYVDADWCRAVNPFQFTDHTKKTVTDNIYCLIKNYLLCEDIETVIFPYGFHGERKGIFDKVIQRLQDGNIAFDLQILVLKCAYDENISRAVKDARDPARVERGMANTFHFYDEYGYPTIDTTDLDPIQTAERIKDLFL